MSYDITVLAPPTRSLGRNESIRAPADLLTRTARRGSFGVVGSSESVDPPVQVPVESQGHMWCAKGRHDLESLSLEYRRVVEVRHREPFELGIRVVGRGRFP